MAKDRVIARKRFGRGQVSHMPLIRGDEAAAREWTQWVMRVESWAR